MSDIGPGDWVECVDNGAWQSGMLPVNLEVGHVYQIEATARDRWDGEPICRVVGMLADTTTGWFALSRFRPIYRPKSSLIRDLLEPVNA